MLRYIAFCALFLLLILVSFWIFAWKWRTDIIAAFLARSCTPCKAQVEQVEWTDKETLKISGILLKSPQGEVVLHISEAHLTTSFFSWVHWFLVPSKRPLFLSRLTLKIEKASPYSFDALQAPFLLAVDEVILICPDGTRKVYGKQSGLLSEILLELSSNSCSRVEFNS